MKRWQVVVVLTQSDGSEWRCPDWRDYWTYRGARRRAHRWNAALMEARVHCGSDLAIRCKFLIEETP